MITHNSIKTGFALSIIASALIGLSASASSQKVIDKNGKLYATENQSGQNSSLAECENIKANIMTQKIGVQPANIMATIVITSGSKKTAFRIFDIAEEALTSSHNIADMQIGCLNREGGIGISIPNTNNDEEDLKIQIDVNGHIFLGYDTVGLELLQPK